VIIWLDNMLESNFLPFICKSSYCAVFDSNAIISLRGVALYKGDGQSDRTDRQTGWSQLVWEEVKINKKKQFSVLLLFFLWFFKTKHCHLMEIIFVYLTQMIEVLKCAISILSFLLCSWKEFEFWCLTLLSAISWRPVLVVEEAGVHWENHRLWASNW